MARTTRGEGAWPEALKAVTGEDRIDATAMLDYLAPLKAWLDEQNKRLAVLRAYWRCFSIQQIS